MERHETQDIQNIPDLDTTVLEALKMLSQATLPSLAPLADAERILLVGSVNALATGQMLFHDHDAVYADEGTYRERFETARDIDTVVIVSASGAKHADGAAAFFKEAGVPTWLITNTDSAPAAAHVDPSRVLVFPKNREPYTYNVSTYLGMLFAKTGEDPADILMRIQTDVGGSVPPDLAGYSAFCFVTPPSFPSLNRMFRTKFDELFGPKLVGRSFTREEIKHAKTVIHSDMELFVTLGTEGAVANNGHEYAVPLAPAAGPAELMAAGYYIIGQIQRQHPPYFKEALADYVTRASEAFGEEITPMVE